MIITLARIPSAGCWVAFHYVRDKRGRLLPAPGLVATHGTHALPTGYRVDVPGETVLREVRAAAALLGVRDEVDMLQNESVWYERLCNLGRKDVSA